jgi:hypothetical protein
MMNRFLAVIRGYRGACAFDPVSVRQEACKNQQAAEVSYFKVRLKGIE